MPGPYDLLHRRHTLLQEAARAFGCPHEIEAIERQAESLSRPFTLVVTGPDGAGKSTVIDRIAGVKITPPVVGLRWRNEYRRFRGAYPYAVVHFQSNPEVGHVLPLARAQRAAAEAAGLAGGDAASITHIVWYVDAPSLPEQVTVVEVPFHEGSDAASLYADADAVLLVIRADQAAPKETRALAAAIGETPAMAVATHMDRLPQARWAEAVRHIRAQVQPSVERVVTLAAHPALSEAELAEAAGTLRREVQRCFLSAAPVLRTQRQARALNGTRERLARRFETLVDRVAADHWTFRELERSAHEALQLRAAEVWRQGEGYLNELQAWANDRGTYSVESSAPASGRPLPPVIVFSSLESRLVSEGRSQLSGVTFGADKRPDGSVHTAAALVRAERPLLPDAPVLPFAILRGDVALAPQPLGMSLRHFQPASNGLEPATGSAHAAIWEEAQDWVSAVAAQAARALKEWITAACGAAYGWLMTQAERLFRAAHGFAPSEAAASVVQMEGHYMRLTGETALVRTPHLPGGWISPALLLFRLQEEGFIRSWNAALARYAGPTVLTQACSRVRQGIGRLSEIVLDEWEESRAEVRRDAAPALKRLTWCQILADRLHWPAAWIPAPLSLRSVALDGRPSRRGGADPAFQGCASLFVRRSPEAFLTGCEKPSTSPEARAVAAVQEELRPELDRLWPVAGPVELPLSVRPSTIRYGMSIVAVLLTLLAAGIVLLGATVQGIAATAGVLLVLGAMLAHGMDHRLRQEIAAGRERYAATLHETIRGRITAQFDALQRRLEELTDSPALRETIEAAMLEHQAEPRPVYLPYGELVRRLRPSGPAA